MIYTSLTSWMAVPAVSLLELAAGTVGVVAVGLYAAVVARRSAGRQAT